MVCTINNKDMVNNVLAGQRITAFLVTLDEIGRLRCNIHNRYFEIRLYLEKSFFTPDKSLAR